VGLLARLTYLRLTADRLGVDSLERDGTIVAIKFRADAPLDPAVLLNLLDARGDLTLLPPAVLRIDLEADPAVPATRPTRQGPWGARLVRPARTAEPAPPTSDKRQADSTRITPDRVFDRLEPLVAQLSQSLLTG
jgi:hypothetical protein